MTFSKFAELLFPFCGGGETESEFILTLIDNIMEEPPNVTDRQKDIDGKYNPLMNLHTGSLYQIFSGRRNISHISASMILGRLDKHRFEEYIYEFSPDALNLLRVSLSEYGIAANLQNIGEVCAGLLEKIIKDCAVKIKKFSTDEIKSESIDGGVSIDIQDISNTIKAIQREQQKTINDLNLLQLMISKYDELVNHSKMRYKIIAEKSGHLPTWDKHKEVFASEQFYLHDESAHGTVQKFIENLQSVIKNIDDVEYSLESVISDDSERGKIPEKYFIRLHRDAEELHTVKKRLSKTLEELNDSEAHHSRIFERLSQIAQMQI